MGRLIALLVAVLLGLLIVTNPGMDAFSAFVAQESERILQEETGDSPLGRVIAGAGSGLVGSYVERVTDRDGYFFFSIYTIDLDGTPDDEAYDWRFLGITDRFIALDNPDEMR